MYVCFCRGVTSSAILKAVEAGAETVTDLGRCTSAGTDCGGCWETMRLMLARYFEQVHHCRPDDLPSG